MCLEFSRPAACRLETKWHITNAGGSALHCGGQRLQEQRAHENEVAKRERGESRDGHSHWVAKIIREEQTNDCRIEAHHVKQRDS